MSILQRVEEIRTGEHMRLRMSLSRAESALFALEEARKNAMSAPHKVDMFGDPKPDEDIKDRHLTRLNLRPLFDAWTPFEEQLLARVDSWEMDLWPLVRRWGVGEPVGEAVRMVTSNLLARRAKLEPSIDELRRQGNFVGEMRAPLMALFHAIEVCDEAEGDVIPALMTGSRELADRTAGAAPQRVRSSDVTRALRSNPNRSRFEREPEPDSGLLSSLGRLMGWTKR